jgi:RIO kinase 2
LNLISRLKNARYDGYRLTYGGLDYLSLHSHLKAGSIYSVGNQIGVGKESDIIVVAAPPDGDGDPANAHKLVLKIHRLGRISFRTVKKNRDYLRNKSSGSWMHMSRLAAHKEYSFLQALYDAGFPVPRPVGWNRHTLVMDLIDALPLRQISSVPDPAWLYGQLIELILRFAKFGLIHGDFNEFNILIEEVPTQDQTSVTLHPIVIDFPQSVSISHTNATFYFDRDVNCIKRFFERRFHFVADDPGPFFEDVIKPANVLGQRRLDLEVEASGFSRKMAKELEAYMKEVGAEGVVDAAKIDDDGENDGEDGEDGGDEEIEGGEDHLDEVPVQVQDNMDAESSHDGAAKEASDAFVALTLDCSQQELPVVTLDDIQQHKSTHDDLVSVAGTSRSRYPQANPAKVARGWAI